MTSFKNALLLGLMAVLFSDADAATRRTRAASDASASTAADLPNLSEGSGTGSPLDTISEEGDSSSGAEAPADAPLGGDNAGSSRREEEVEQDSPTDDSAEVAKQQSAKQQRCLGCGARARKGFKALCVAALLGTASWLGFCPTAPAVVHDAPSARAMREMVAAGWNAQMMAPMRSSAKWSRDALCAASAGGYSIGSVCPACADHLGCGSTPCTVCAFAEAESAE